VVPAQGMEEIGFRRTHIRRLIMGLHFKDFNSLPDAWKDAAWDALRKQKKPEVNDVQPADSAAEPKRGEKNRVRKVRPKEVQALQRFAARINLRVHCYRHRLLDDDNTDIKALQDIIVALGLVENDTAAQVISEKPKQTKISKDKPEYTEITITEV
jgi:hypothetical protein